MSSRLVRIYNICAVAAAIVVFIGRLLFSPKILVVLLFIFMLIWTSSIGKQIRYYRWRLDGVPAKEARIMADADIGKDSYFESIEKIRKLVRRDPEWAARKLLYYAAPRYKDIDARNLNKIERWHDSDVRTLRFFKEAFMKEGYVWWQGDNLVVKKVADDGETQELFEKAMILAETGRIDSNYAFALYNYKEEHKEELEEELYQKH